MLPLVAKHLSFPPTLPPLQRYVSQHLLDASGHWGTMDLAKWDAFLDFLSDTGLLTTKVQSRQAAEAGDVAASLDGLRAGDVGEALPRNSISAAQLATNEYLAA